MTAMTDSRDFDAPLVVIRTDRGREAALPDTLDDLRTRSAFPDAPVRTLEPGSDVGAELVALRREQPKRDVVILQAGIRLPFAWDARLAKAVHSDPRIAAVSPLSDASPLHVLVDANNAGRADVAAIDRAVFCLSDRVVHEAPSLHGLCAYIRGDVLDAVLAEVTETSQEDFPERFRRACCARGLVVGLADFVYVDGSGVGAEALPQPPPTLEDKAFILHRPYSRLARALNAGLEDGLPTMSWPGLDAKPVVLHVMHYWGGGADRWVRDFATADGDRTHLLLATYRIGESGGQRVVLYADPVAKVPVRTWDIAKPIPATVVGSLEYRRILDEVVRDFCVDGVMVSSLIGHSLDALELARPTVFVGHDFYPVCESINPWLGQPCRRCGGTAESCAIPVGAGLAFGEEWLRQWPALRERFVATLGKRAIPIVVPSRSAADLWQRIEPRLSAHPMHVIPHGLADPGAPLPWSAPAPGDPLRLVVLGRIAANKGLALLEAAAPSLAGVARVTLVGCGPRGLRLAQACGWDAIESYAPPDLRDILARLAPHAGILASMVPETFSYTLSELQALGIPPLATCLGAFAERVEEGESGLLFEPNATALAELVQRLSADAGPLQRIATSLASAPRPRAPGDMVRDYHALLPLPVQPVARFPLGDHPGSALTDPYEQLDRAYRDLSAAYETLRAAYEAQRGAYEHVNAAYATRDRDYNEVRAKLDALSAELELLKSRPAAAFISRLRRKITSHGES